MKQDCESLKKTDLVISYVPDTLPSSLRFDKNEVVLEQNKPINFNFTITFGAPLISSKTGSIQYNMIICGLEEVSTSPIELSYVVGKNLGNETIITKDPTDMFTSKLALCPIDFTTCRISNYSGAGEGVLTIKDGKFIVNQTVGIKGKHEITAECTTICGVVATEKVRVT